MPTYADILKKERIQKGWTQEQLAEQVGASVATVSRWEAGRNKPTPFYAIQLTHVFEKSVEALGLLAPSMGATASLHAIEQAPRLLSHSQDGTLRDPWIPSAPFYIGREEEIQHIKRRLLADSPPITVLHGLPGVGKTALLAALAYDQDIRARYADGILWASLGPEPDYRDILMHWSLLLHVHPDPHQGYEHWSRALREAIGSRQMLLLLDDAWHLKDIHLLALGGPHCTHLVTTRAPALAAPFVGAMQLHEFTYEQSWALLHHLVPTVVEQETQKVKELIAAAGGLPLTLTLIGQYLRQQAYSDQPRRITMALDRLTDAKERLQLEIPLDVTESTSHVPTVRQTSLRTRLEIIDRQLTKQMRDAFYALAVFPAKPHTFSEEAALQIAACSVETLDALTDRGVLETSGDRYLLHPILKEYALLCVREHPILLERSCSRFLSYAFHLLEEQGNDLACLEQEIPVLLAALELAWQMQHQDALRLTQVCATTWWKHAHSLQQAEPYFQHGWELAQREQGQTLKSGLLCLLALAHCASLRNETMRAIQLCGQAVISAQTLKEEQHVLAMAFMALGIAYLRGAREYGHTSFYANARLYCQEALDLAETLPRALQLHMPLMYKVLGTVTVEMGESSQQALAYYAHGITLAEAFHDTDEAGLLRLHSARVLFLQGELRASEAMVQQVLQLGTHDQQQREGQREEGKAKTWYEHGLYRLLDILLYEHRVEEVKVTLQRLQEINTSRKAQLALYRGKYALMQQEYTQAEHCYQEALQLAHEQKERSPFLREVYNDLVLVAIGQQDVKKAFLHIGELQGSLHAAEGSVAQAYVHVRRAQFLSLWKLPEKARDEAHLALAIFQKSGHVLGMREVAICLEQIQASEEHA